ncbi:hypothetical protein CesoFtcFv8_022267 [Champsocephalus esox]|uniref:Uncharacterized protein n=1 Tax=Champsocephalus esox TaxID=159716 RepID=A0AAN8BBJ3_9TELE|nr:hypothetical protein CesoFtcFv8_022267 [Champsocephalus esox]
MTQKEEPDSLSQTHSTSLRELCGTAALCRKSSLGAVAPVLGSAATSLPLAPSSPPVLTQIYHPASPPEGCLRATLLGKEGNMQDQRL